MEGLFDIPVIGVVIQLLGYLGSVVVQNGPIILALAAPLALGALCGVMNERSGVVNIGIEGMMLASAFAGWFAASVAFQSMGKSEPGEFFGVTPPLLIGLVAAILTGVVLSAIHAWLSITVRADQIISGTIINIVAVGITGYLNLLLSKNSPPTAGKFEPFVPPHVITDLPLVGWLFRMFLAQGPVTMLAIVLAIVLQILLFRTRWGLRTRAVGEHPRAAETVGINVIATRYRNVILGGLFAGLAGAWFTLDFGNSFQTGMTNGRGFIALAALIFGRWHPLGAFGAALLFAYAGSLGTAIRTLPPTGQLGDILSAIPPQFFSALPYVVTIVILAGVVGRSIPPASVGRPYEKEGAH
ncbi:MAG TPA: ABC transporter permease [Candidatus Limnocylindrales bacterium]|nr:ABC transporter permease [Candidatus Limnocylindrales bacterium]